MTSWVPVAMSAYQVNSRPISKSHIATTTAYTDLVVEASNLDVEGVKNDKVRLGAGLGPTRVETIHDLVETALTAALVGFLLN